MKYYFSLIFIFLISLSCISETSVEKSSVITGRIDEALPYLLVPYRVKSLWGFSDMNGNIKIAPQYDDVKQIKYYWTDGSSFQSVMIVRKAGKLFAINHHNHIIVPSNENFDDLNADEYYYSVVFVTKQGSKGVYYQNKQIIPCLYTSVEREKNLSFRVLAGGKSGIINSKGKIIVPVEYFGMHVKNFDKKQVTWLAGRGNNEQADFQDDLVVDPGKQEGHSYNSSVGVPPRLIPHLLDSQLQVRVVNNVKKQFPGAIMDPRNALIFYIKRNGKTGVFNVLKNKQTIPCEYDTLIAQINNGPHIAIFARKGLLYGFLDEDNDILAPVIFSGIVKLGTNFRLQQGNKLGLLTDDLHYIEPKYLSIKYSSDVYDAKTSALQTFFEVTNATGMKGFINQAGFQYFSD